MHIPDGFVDLKTALTTGALAAAGLGVALRQTQLHLPPRRVPLLGLASAFVFAAQMLNFPVIGGTSGHLIGGVLAAALLGPSAAVIVISAVLIVQCFLFADGGITALGANVFNMALVGTVGGWVVYALITRFIKGLFGQTLAVIFAGWCSTVLAAITCAGELAASHTVGWAVAFSAMAGVHMLIGIGEGVITALVLVAIAKVRPDLLAQDQREPRAFEVIPTNSASSQPPIPCAPVHPAAREKTGPLLAFGLLISLGLALFVAPHACPWPDGLDKTAEVLGFKHKEAETRVIPTPVADYKMPGIHSDAVATSLAGAAGVIFVFGLAWLLARILVPKPNPRDMAPPASPQ